MTAATSSGSTNGRVLCETSRALPLVSFTIAARTGALEDPIGKEGLFRLTSRLVRRTGAGLSPEELDLRIDSLGGALGVEVGQSAATFQGTVISRSLDAFSDLLVGVIAKPSLSEQEFGKLKRETLAEIVELRDHDRELAQRWFGRKLFSGHPYGRSITGTPKSIEAIAVGDTASLHGLVTTPPNLIFAFAGDLDEARAHSIADRVRAALGDGEPRADSIPEPSPKSGRHLVIVDKPERTQTQILIGGLGTHPSDADHLALHVGNTIFGGTFTARLMQEVRAKRGWSYGAYSNLPYDRHRRAFSLWTFPKAADAAACIALELELLEKWVSAGVTPKELNWAKRYLVRSHAFAIDTAGKRVGQALDEEVYQLPAGYHSEYVDRIKALSLEDVNLAIKNRISPENLLVTILGTATDIQDPVRASIPRLESTEVIPFDAD
jgi:zinc protease